MQNPASSQTNRQAALTVGAGALSPADGQFFGGMFGGDNYRTVPLQMVTDEINGGDGFELKISGGFFGGFVSGFTSSVTVRFENGDFTSDDHMTGILVLTVSNLPAPL